MRLDAIGDYILFRNFLEVIKRSERFKDYRITLCGNELWKDIAEAFDHEFVDEFVWVKRNRFLSDREYRRDVLKVIANSGFETAICPSASRSFLLGDAVIRASHAPVRIGSKRTQSIDNFLFGFIGSSFYTELINNTKPPFEFDKNLVFFETLLNKPLNIQLPYISNIEQNRAGYIIVFPGAGEPERQWNTHKFSGLVDYFVKQHNYKVLIAGSSSDTGLAKEIIAGLKNDTGNVEDITGKTKLNELIELIANAMLVIAHDSGALHMAIAAKTSVIGLMTGKHFKRFGPYTYQPVNALLLFPKPEEQYEKLFDKYGPSYFEGIVNNINEITLERVIEECKILLK